MRADRVLRPHSENDASPESRKPEAPPLQGEPGMSGVAGTWGGAPSKARHRDMPSLRLHQRVRFTGGNRKPKRTFSHRRQESFRVPSWASREGLRLGSTGGSMSSEALWQAKPASDRFGLLILTRFVALMPTHLWVVRPVANAPAAQYIASYPAKPRHFPLFALPVALGRLFARTHQAADPGRSLHHGATRRCRWPIWSFRAFSPACWRLWSGIADTSETCS